MSKNFNIIIDISSDEGESNVDLILQLPLDSKIFHILYQYKNLQTSSSQQQPQQQPHQQPHNNIVLELMVYAGKIY